LKEGDTVAYQNLKALRESLSMSQKDFAASIGIRQTTYNGYETGAREPKSDFWITVAEKYGVTIDYLMGFSNDPHRTSSGKKITPLYSSEAMKIAKDFDTLDSHGQSAVRGLMDEELNRMAELDELAEFQEAEEEKIIPYYLSPYAAGSASPMFGEEYEDYTLQNGDPKGAMFAVKVQGDSMEPYFPNESMVFCNKDPMRDGDIGVFIVDGGGVKRHIKSIIFQQK
jgi:putative phage repressor